MLDSEFFVNYMEMHLNTFLNLWLFFQHFAKMVQFTGPVLKHCNVDIHHLCHMSVI